MTQTSIRKFPAISFNHYEMQTHNLASFRDIHCAGIHIMHYILLYNIYIYALGGHRWYFSISVHFNFYIGLYCFHFSLSFGKFVMYFCNF